MKQQFKYSFLLLGVAMLLLHSFIPHRHHTEMSNVEHSTLHNKAQGFIDYLGLAFQNGNGYSADQVLEAQRDTHQLKHPNWKLLNCSDLHLPVTALLVSPAQVSLHALTIRSQFVFFSYGLRAPPLS